MYILLKFINRPITPDDEGDFAFYGFFHFREDALTCEVGVPEELQSDKSEVINSPIKFYGKQPTAHYQFGDWHLLEYTAGIQAMY